MAEDAISVWLLAGRLEAAEARDLSGLAARLGRRGVRARVACVGTSGQGADDFLVLPGLASRWGRGRTARRLVGVERKMPRLIHVLDPTLAAMGIDLAERFELPYLLTVDDFPPTGSGLRISRHWCRRVVANDHDLAADLAGGMGVPGSRLAVVPFGIEPPEKGMARLSASRVPVVGTAARLEPGSGVSTFLQAALRLVGRGVEAEFVVAGTGRAEADLRRLSDRLGIAGRVTFVDDPAKGRPFWDVLHVFCQPALAPTTGRSLARALSRGVPAVASDVPGLRPWLHDGLAGQLVPPGDPSALADAVADLLARPEQAAAMGRHGHDLALVRADPDREADSLANLYTSVVDEARSPSLDGAIADTSRPHTPRRHQGAATSTPRDATRDDARSSSSESLRS